MSQNITCQVTDLQTFADLIDEATSVEKVLDTGFFTIHRISHPKHNVVHTVTAPHQEVLLIRA